jgi:hypothetical protein
LAHAGADKRVALVIGNGAYAQPTVIARRLDYLADPLFAGKLDANPRYR